MIQGYLLQLFQIANIGNLSKLEQITLYQNNLKELPDSFSKLQLLEKLNLSWNDFKELPPQVSDLKNLQWFAYFYNEETKMSGMDHIETVILEKN